MPLGTRVADALRDQISQQGLEAGDELPERVAPRRAVRCQRPGHPRRAAASRQPRRGRDTPGQARRGQRPAADRRAELLHDRAGSGRPPRSKSCSRAAPPSRSSGGAPRGRACGARRGHEHEASPRPISSNPEPSSTRACPPTSSCTTRSPKPVRQPFRARHPLIPLARTLRGTAQRRRATTGPRKRSRRSGRLRTARSSRRSKPATPPRRRLRLAPSSPVRRSSLLPVTDPTLWGSPRGAGNRAPSRRPGDRASEGSARASPPARSFGTCDAARAPAATSKVAAPGEHPPRGPSLDGSERGRAPTSGCRA